MIQTSSSQQTPTPNRVEDNFTGLLFIASGIQWILGVLIAESLHPGYNSNIHYISTLGRPPTAMIFTGITVLLGILVALAAIRLAYFTHDRGFTLLLLITSIGAVGVGIYPETIQPAHGIYQSFALIGGSLNGLLSYRIQSRPFAILSAVLGGLSLTTIIIFFPYLGLALNDPVTLWGMGKGILERIVIYPLIIWLITFGVGLLKSL